jgi:hypothetical protein
MMTEAITNVFMVDLETGGLAPGSAILEVAAAEFVPQTGEILREWCESIDLLDSLRLGLTIDAETAAYHLRNGYSGDLRGTTLWRALQGLDVFLHQHHEEIEVWAWGKDFEAKHFEHVLGMLGMPALWDFRNLHCARDRWMAARGDAKPGKRQHKALADVRSQVRDLAEVYGSASEKSPN